MSLSWPPTGLDEVVDILGSEHESCPKLAAGQLASIGPNPKSVDGDSKDVGCILCALKRRFHVCFHLILALIDSYLLNYDHSGVVTGKRLTSTHSQKKNFFRYGHPELPTLENLPIHLSYIRSWLPTCAVYEIHGQTFLIQEGWCDETEEDPWLYGDPVALYEGLQRAKTPEQAAEFLSRSGPWLRWETPEPMEETRIIPWTDFCEWQLYFEKMKLGEHAEPPSRGRAVYEIASGKIRTRVESLDGFTVGEFKANSRGILVATYRCESAAEAISAAIRIEQMQNIKYRRCAFEGCKQRIFKLGFRRDRRFCDETCQHAAGQRRRRKGAKPGVDG